VLNECKQKKGKVEREAYTNVLFAKHFANKEILKCVEGATKLEYQPINEDDMKACIKQTLKNKVSLKNRIIKRASEKIVINEGYTAFDEINYNRINYTQAESRDGLEPTAFLMIHNVYQSFSFTLYNNSHKVKEGEEAHKASKIILRFPENENFLLIFQKDVFHGGGASKCEGHVSFNVAHDLRLFSYCSVYDTVKKRVNRSGYPGDDERIVNYESFKECSSDCVNCKSFYKKQKIRIMF